MAEPYVGEIRQFGGNFAPVGWQFCNGQIVPISQYDVLFNLIGTTYGGDGQSTFGLPDLRGRVPLHMGNGYSLGQRAGVESVTLASGQLPSHSHAVNCAATGGSDAPANNVWGAGTANIYATAPGTLSMNPSSVGIAGNTQPHDNMHPFLAVSFIIATEGIYPTQS